MYLDNPRTVRHCPPSLSFAIYLETPRTVTISSTKTREILTPNDLRKKKRPSSIYLGNLQFILVTRGPWRQCPPRLFSSLHLGYPRTVTILPTKTRYFLALEWAAENHKKCPSSIYLGNPQIILVTQGPWRHCPQRLEPSCLLPSPWLLLYAASVRYWHPINRK